MGVNVPITGGTTYCQYTPSKMLLHQGLTAFTHCAERAPSAERAVEGGGSEGVGEAERRTEWVGRDLTPKSYFNSYLHRVDSTVSDSTETGLIFCGILTIFSKPEPIAN